MEKFKLTALLHSMIAVSLVVASFMIGMEVTTYLILETSILANVLGLSDTQIVLVWCGGLVGTLIYGELVNIYARIVLKFKGTKPQKFLN